MTQKHKLQSHPGGTLTPTESTLRPLAKNGAVEVTTITGKGDEDNALYRSTGMPSTQSPQEFYAEFSGRPKIREILTELAKR